MRPHRLATATAALLATVALAVACHPSKERVPVNDSTGTDTTPARIISDSTGTDTTPARLKIVRDSLHRDSLRRKGGIVKPK